MNSYTENQNEIRHHGILGMKWGVSKKKSKASSDERANQSISRRREELKKMKKNRKLLSDKTLKDKIARIKLEKEFKNLVEEDLSPGKKVVSEILSESGKKAATTMLSGAMVYAGKAIVSQAFDKKELGDAIFNGGAKKK